MFEVYVKVTKCCVQGKSRGHMLRGGQRAPPGPSRAHPKVGGMGRATGGLTLGECFQQQPPDLGRGEEGGCVLEKQWGSGNGRGIPGTRQKLESPYFPSQGGVDLGPDRG